MKNDGYVTITWEIDDGYAGKSRPQTTRIPRTELDGCETKEEREEVIADYVHNDFEARITWVITNTSE